MEGAARAGPRLKGRAGGSGAARTVIAIDSLSKPPATERIRWAGRIAISPAAATPALALPDTSAASAPVKRAATAPKPAGMRTHTSLSEVGMMRCSTS